MPVKQMYLTNKIAFLLIIGQSNGQIFDLFVQAMEGKCIRKEISTCAIIHLILPTQSNKQINKFQGKLLQECPFLYESVRQCSKGAVTLYFKGWTNRYMYSRYGHEIGRQNMPLQVIMIWKNMPSLCYLKYAKFVLGVLGCIQITLTFLI